MSKVFKPRRGSADLVAAFIGEANEVILNTTTNTLHVMDGLTAGGFPLARADEVAAKNDAQDAAIAEAKSSADAAGQAASAASGAASAAQNTANTALDRANNITVPVTSVNGMTGAVTVGTVRSVNGATADAAGNVTISATPSTVKGVIGSAVAANGTSMTLPSGGTWFVFNTAGDSYTAPYTGHTMQYFGVSNNSTNTNFNSYGATYSGGTTVYAKMRDNTGEDPSYSLKGKLVAVRIS